MALTESAGAAWTAVSSTNTQSAGSFTPAANALVAAIVSFSNGNGIAATSLAVTSNFTGTCTNTWVLVGDYLPTTSAGGGGIWVMDAGSAPGAGVVTATASPGNVLDVALIVRQFAGAAPAASQTGVTASNHGTVDTVSITPLTTGSQIVGTIACVTSPTANAATSFYGSTAGSHGDWCATFEAASLSTSGTQQVLGFSATQAHVAIVAAEILPVASAAPAGLATAAGTAQAGAPAIATTAGLATATGTIPASSLAQAGLATATGTAVAPVTGRATAGLATATGIAQQPGKETSPALILSGFGPFSGVHPWDTISNVTVALTHKEATGATAPSVQLWDSTNAQIGTTQTGTASAIAITDNFIFTGVSYAQLGTLQVRVSGNGFSGSEEFVDSAGLLVVYVPGTPPMSRLVTQAPDPPERPVFYASPRVISGPPPATGNTTAPAGLATAYGTVQNPSTPNLAGLATATGTARQPSAGGSGNIAITAGSATAAGTALGTVPAAIGPPPPWTDLPEQAPSGGDGNYYSGVSGYQAVSVAGQYAYAGNLSVPGAAHSGCVASFTFVGFRASAIGPVAPWTDLPSQAAIGGDGNQYPATSGYQAAGAAGAFTFSGSLTFAETGHSACVASFSFTGPRASAIGPVAPWTDLPSQAALGGDENHYSGVSGYQAVSAINNFAYSGSLSVAQRGHSACVATFSLSPAGTTWTGIAPMDGEGTLGGNWVFAGPMGQLLSGSGTLSAGFMGTLLQNAALDGEGRMAGTGYGSHLYLSGSGTLSQAGWTLGVSAPLSGLGTLFILGTGGTKQASAGIPVPEAYPGSSLVSIAPPGTQSWRYLGSIGLVTALTYSFIFPGGSDQLSTTLMVPATYRDQVLTPGWQVRVTRGGHVAWTGRMDEPVPTATGWNITAVGDGNRGADFEAVYTDAWPVNEPDEAVNNAIARGLPWTNPGIGQPAGAWFGQAPDPGSVSIAGLLALVCTRGGLAWYAHSQPDGTGAKLIVGPLPTVVDRLLVVTDPVPRTLGGDINTIWIRYQSAAAAGTASATYGLTSVQNAASVAVHGVTETYVDLSSAGTMTAGGAQAVGNYVLSIYQRASFAGPFTASYGTLLNTGGAPIDPSTDQAARVIRPILTDYGYGGEPQPQFPLQFIVGGYSWDDFAGKATITPYQSLDLSLSGLLGMETTILTPITIQS